MLLFYFVFIIYKVYAGRGRRGELQAFFLIIITQAFADMHALIVQGWGND